MVLAAAIAHLIAEVMFPATANQSRFELPLNLIAISYWRVAAALYLGYLIAIAVFCFIKRNVMPSPAVAH
jgi:hypothetical protein